MEYQLLHQAKQDTNEHTVLDNSDQQPMYKTSSGQILQSIQLNQLEMGMRIIVNFSAELINDLLYQQQRDPSNDLPHSSLVCNYSS